MALWALAGELTVPSPGPLLPLAAMVTLPASKALSASAAIVPVSPWPDCISATMILSPHITAWS